MAHPVATTNMAAPTRIESRQARLDAAIALFRSEASASGYVVEEVRLRLPVPDVDVMPRVIIAQQCATTGTPPAFPRPPKHHRTLNVYPHPVSNDNPPVSSHGNPYHGPQDVSYHVPASGAQTEHKPPPRANNPPTSVGFKRTVSGSVIFHPMSARTPLGQRENGPRHDHSPRVSRPMVPPASMPYTIKKDARPLLTSHEKPTVPPQRLPQYWNTMMNGEKEKAILRAAESMHRMRHGHLESRFNRPDSDGQNPKPMDVSEPDQTVTRKNPIPDMVSKSSSASITNPMSSTNKSSGESCENRPNRNLINVTMSSADNRNKEMEKEENTHHINGHSIPESHVQLLLSSAADISARERVTTADSSTNKLLDGKQGTEDKKTTTRPQAVVNGKPSGAKVAPVSSGKSFSSRRREGSDRQVKSMTPRPFKCTKCPSSFDRDGHLRVHILAVHEKKRPFVCQLCDASFGHSSSLLRHVRTVHQASPAVGSGRTSNGSKNPSTSNDSGTTRSEDIRDNENEGEAHFRCSACGQTFNRVALLNRHVANKHPLQSPTSQKPAEPRNSS